MRVLDQNNAVLSGVTVNFSVNPTSGVLSPASATTGSNGEASTTLQLGSVAGSYTVTARVSSIAQQVTFTATATEPPPPPPPQRIPTSLELVSGNNQVGEINQYLRDPLVVKVLDQDGVELSGVTVNFSVSPSSGVLNPTSATTGSNGEASTALQLGNTVGSYTGTARVSSIAQSVTFTATATDPPRATTLELVSGNNQSGKINEHLRDPLVVRVLDQYGAVLSGVTVNFSVNPSSGVLNPTSATTGSNGEASTALQLGNTVGSYTVTARVSSIAQLVTFTATATDPPRATTLAYRRGNGQSAEINQPLANPLVVRVLDQNNAVLSGVTVNFSVNPSSGVLNPTSATTGSNGEASTALQLGNTVGSYTVTASASGIAQSVTFTATATNPPPPPPPSRIATTLELVSGNNQSGEINQRLTAPLVVRVRDQNSAVLSGVTVNFTVSPTSGALNPTSDTTNANGQASTTLTLGRTAESYIVTARVSGIAQSVTFTATATNPPAANLNPTPQQPPPPPPPPPPSPPAGQQWLVWIYYPENYKGPLSPDRKGGDYGFTIEDLSAGAEITQFAQTYNPCGYDRDPKKEELCNSHYDEEGKVVEDGEEGISRIYAAQFKFETSQENVTFRVVWKENSDDVQYWNPHKPPGIDSEIDLSTYTDILKLREN